MFSSQSARVSSSRSLHGSFSSYEGFKKLDVEESSDALPRGWSLFTTTESLHKVLVHCCLHHFISIPCEWVYFEWTVVSMSFSAASASYTAISVLLLPTLLCGVAVKSVVGVVHAPVVVL